MSTLLVLDVLDVAGGGGGSDLPVVGISPAKVEAESAHMSASAIAKRFIRFSSYRGVEKTMFRFLHKKDRNNNAGLLARKVRATCAIKLGRFNIAAFSFAHLRNN